MITVLLVVLGLPVLYGAVLCLRELRELRGAGVDAQIAQRRRRRARWHLATAAVGIASAIAVLAVADAADVRTDVERIVVLASLGWAMVVLNGLLPYYAFQRWVLKRSAGTTLGRELLLCLVLAPPLAWLVTMLDTRAPWLLLVSIAPLGFMFERWLRPDAAPVPGGVIGALDAATMTRLADVTARCGYPQALLLRVDDGGRSANAQARNGRPPQVLLWDALLQRLAADEIEAVVAHELGHLRLRHHLRRSLWQLLRWIGATLLLALLWRHSGLARTQWLIVGIGLLPLLWLTWTPLLASLQRRYEREADAFTVASGLGPALASALRKLDSAAMDLGQAPAAAYRRYYRSHPLPQQRQAWLDTPMR